MAYLGKVKKSQQGIILHNFDKGGMYATPLSLMLDMDKLKQWETVSPPVLLLPKSTPTHFRICLLTNKNNSKPKHLYDRTAKGGCMPAVVT